MNKNRHAVTWMNKQKALGLCIVCPDKKLPDAALCEMHYFKRMAYHQLGQSKFWRKLKKKLKTQNYRCYLTGEILVLGLNASLDHIEPVSEFPELAHVIENVAWCTKIANRVKRNLSRGHFVRFCRAVVAFHDASDF